MTQPKHALINRRAKDFAAWYQEVVTAADLAEESGVRGCMVIRPWGYGIWERMQRLLDDQIKATGHENCYFPLFIPLSYFEREADHVDGFAKEMAVVTHHRLIKQHGRLVPDPDARLDEPMIVRPTSETVIGAAFSRWVKSWRDLPILINQWANVVRWEMRTRMFLRTTEFLWQEGHTAHANADEAMDETLKILELYRAFAEESLAMPVIAGEKPEHERFPGAVATYSIEAMMQDGKALQMGTSHYLGTAFSQAQNIRYQNPAGVLELTHTTSWGVSTRMIGGVIMTHGDDDGLCVPPHIAPYQIIIIPMTRGDVGDDALLEYCQLLVEGLRSPPREGDASGGALGGAFGEPIRVLFDKRTGKAAHKRWAWIKRGAPIIVEVGPRDMAQNIVSWFRRDALYRADGKLNSDIIAPGEFIASAAGVLESIQQTLLARARVFQNERIHRDACTLDDIAAIFADKAGHPGWVEIGWSRPTGAALAAVVAQLKAMQLTIRNVPLGAAVPTMRCPFTGELACEVILIGRSY